MIPVIICIISIVLAYLSTLSVHIHSTADDLTENCPFFGETSDISFDVMVKNEFPNGVLYTSPLSRATGILDGLSGKDVVFLLHGFPDTIITWQAMNRMLVTAGLKIIPFIYKARTSLPILF